MPHPLLLGALASVVRASEPSAALVPQDGAPFRTAAVAVADSTARAASVPGGAAPAPAGGAGAESATFTAAAPAAGPAVAPAGGALTAAVPAEGTAYAPAPAAGAARAAAPASEAAAARVLRPATGTAAPQRVASAARPVASGVAAAFVLPTLVGERARYRSRDPYVAATADEHIADSIVVEKGSRKLTLFRLGTVVRTYPIALGGQPAGHKVQRGDKRTPEGLYYIEARNPHSRYHLALRVSYPNTFDLWRARALGVSPGGDIMIHGLPNGQGYVGEQHRLDDWTEGCIAVTNAEIEEIWRSVPVGTPIQIKP